MNVQDEESYVRNVILPELIRGFKHFTQLLANRDFAKLAQLFPLGCSAQEFQDAVELNETDGQFVEPPCEAYNDVEYSGTLTSFLIGDVSCTSGFHNVNVYSDKQANLEFSADMYMWDAKGRTDVSLLFTLDNSLVNHPRISSVDMYLM